MFFIFCIFLFLSAKILILISIFNLAKTKTVSFNPAWSLIITMKANCVFYYGVIEMDLKRGFHKGKQGNLASCSDFYIIWLYFLMSPLWVWFWSHKVGAILHMSASYLFKPHCDIKFISTTLKGYVVTIEWQERDGLLGLLQPLIHNLWHFVLENNRKHVAWKAKYWTDIRKFRFSQILPPRCCASHLFFSTATLRHSHLNLRRKRSIKQSFAGQFKNQIPRDFGSWSYHKPEYHIKDMTQFL